MNEPMRITAIKPTQRDISRFTIRVGTGKGRGRVVATLNHREIDRLGLAVDQPWDDALEIQVAAAAVNDKAFRAAMNRLARRAMSAGMIRQKLRELGHDEAVRDRVIERLDGLGLIDDEAFGQALIRETTRSKPAGPRLLRQKLFQKKLDSALIDRLLAEHEEAQQTLDDPDAEAIAFAVKRARTLERFDAATQRRRLYGQLARRGFAPGTITRAMAAALHGDRDD